MGENGNGGIIPQWNGKSDGIDLFEDQCRVYNAGTKKDDRIYVAARIIGKMDPHYPAYKRCIKIDDEKLEIAEGWKAIITCLRETKGPKPMAEATKCFKNFIHGVGCSRKKSEGARDWITRLELLIEETGKQLHAACSEIPAKDFIHELLLGILAQDWVNLEPQEIASVLSTSFKVSDDGLTKEPNSYRFSDFCNSLLEQWSDDSLKERDRIKYDAKKSRSGAHGADSWEYDFDQQSGEYSEFAASLQHSEENVAELSLIHI